MNPNSHAVLIGVNECQDKDLRPLLYAEKDCHDMRDVLTSVNSGIFPEGNVRILVGSDATTNTIKRVLRAEVVTNRNENDLVLVYFAGHGFVHELEDRKRTYLGTYDADVQTIYEYPHEGLEMDFLHNEIFTATKAKVVLVILDCCHSGAIVPDTLRDTGARKEDSVKRLKNVNKNELNLVDGRYISGSGRVALVACAADAFSREAQELKNGIFTHYLVKGLAGKAAEPTSGDVTLDSLASYIRYKLPRDQEPVRYGQDVGRLILAQNKQFGIRIKKPSSIPAVEPKPLSHPLEPLDSFLYEVIDRVRNEEASQEGIESRILSAIRKSLKVDAAYILGGSEDEVIVRTFSESSSERRNLKSDLTRVVSLLAPQVLDERFTRMTSYGLFYVDDNLDQRSTRLVVIPATFEPATDVVVISGMRDATLISSAFGAIIAALFTAARNLKPEQEYLLEHAVLDDLKKYYRFLPIAMYNRRLALFRERLNRMTSFFQPIVFLRLERPSLDSWEALARDPETRRAPKDLFTAAELWGRKFMRELDCYFLWKATDLSRTHHAFSGPAFDKEISINVYPQSIMDDKYSDRLGEIIKQGLLTPEKLTLEISEKVPISTLDIYESADEELHVFKDRLEEYVHRHHVTFAIDDFGVRHSSVSRLARLNPAYVKIDRDVLLSDFAGLIIKFVLDLTKKGRLRPVKCVIEGFDVDSRISLARLYQLGVRYVQGFKIEIPTPQPDYIGDVKIASIGKLLADRTQMDDTIFR